MRNKEKVEVGVDGLLDVGGVRTGGGNGAGTHGELRKEARAWSSQLLRRVVLAGLAACVLVVCRWLAYELRFDFDVAPMYQAELRSDWFWVIGLQLGWLLLFRQFSGIYKYFSLPEIRCLGYAMILSALSLYAVGCLGIGAFVPRGVLLMQCMLGFLALGGMRSAWRMIHERWFSCGKDRHSHQRKVAIIGAGDAGASLVRELRAHPNLGLVPVAFLDDDRGKWGSRIHGVPVIGAPEVLERKAKMLEVAEVVIAMPSAPARRLGEVVSLLHKTGLEHVTVPSLDQLTSGSVRISQLRPVKIEDLLGRESIDLKADQIGGALTNRRVLVTGAGGSIGSELCRQVAAYHPSRLLLLDQSEVQLFQVEQELIRLGYGSVIVPVIADILDKPRMAAVLAQHKTAVIFHAAAHKHVGLMENQPGEAIKNNTLGTAALAELACEHGVEQFVMISTDKAVNPTSAMGASKRLAEVFLQSFAREHDGRTRFAAVRFGNVLGSSGSVVPIFERQIAEGGPVTVTDPEVVRYFMTIPEAVGLVLQSCAQGRGGEIFVLDMGKPVKIIDLARQMIRLSGLEPGRDIEIKFTGLKPGEKLFEELRYLRANTEDTAHPRIKRLTSEPMALKEVRARLGWLNSQLHSASPDELKLMLKQVLPEYTPALSAGKKAAEGRVQRRNLERTRQCPRFNNGEEGVVRTDYCNPCSSFRLCAWQFGWNGNGETEGGASEDGGRRTEDGRRKTEDGGRRRLTTDHGPRTTEDGRRRTEDGRRKTEDGGQKQLTTEHSLRTTDHGPLKTEDGGRRTEDGGRRTEDGGRRTEDGGRKTEDGGRRTETTDCGALTWMASQKETHES